MVGDSHQKVFLIQIDASSFAEFELSVVAVEYVNYHPSLRQCFEKKMQKVFLDQTLCYLAVDRDTYLAVDLDTYCLSLVVMLIKI